MQDVTNGEINCVIVKDLSRLGREYIETGRYLRRVFPAYGVRFIAITDNIDTAQESSGDDLTVSVKNIMNEAYCRDISVKTRTSLDVKRRNGDFVGAFTVYGYIKSEDNKNLLVPDPYASRVVQNIFQMRLEGSSALRIANELNRLGILSPLAYKKNHGLPYARRAMPTERIANGQPRPSSACCRMKPIPGHWYRVSKAPPTIKSSRWSRNRNPNGFAFPTPTSL